MNPSWWISESASQIRSNGVEGLRWSARQIYHKFWQSTASFVDEGTPIYERDWDLLIVLDACRLDLFEQVAEDYNYISEVRSVRSLDTMTPAWMEKNFTPDYRDEMEDTVYICGNPFSRDILEPSLFAELNEVWRSVWEEPGTVPPEAITDETIRLFRNSSSAPDRVIAHYMQPHCPFVSKPELSKGKDVQNFGEQRWKDVWERLRDGEVSKDEVWEGYQDNLELVLSNIEILIENIDVENVVITSDHGNAIGEYGLYGHPRGMPHKCLKEVPWVEITAEDTGSYNPTTEFEDVDVSTEEKLKALGYK
ncbi:hypothetical protein [Haloferax volcanii]|uniref:hypothetical protein n=1 Tax=Haloferax volcanii TaxID=2246 RepID=UPI003D3020BB